MNEETHQQQTETALTRIDGGTSTIEEVELNTLQALAHVIVGGIVEGTDLIVTRLEDHDYLALDDGDDGPSEYDLVRYAAIGLAVETAEVTGQILNAAASGTALVAKVAVLPLKPVARVGKLFMRPVRAVLPVPSVEGIVRELIEVGRLEEAISRKLVHDVVLDLVGDTVDLLGQSPAVAALIDSQVDRLLPELADNPDIQMLIQEQAGQYLDYLTDNPEAVEELILSQLRSLLPDLVHSPELRDLIRQQAADYMAYLDGEPGIIQELIRTQGDAYIEYLNKNPDQVQQLVAGQGVSLASDVMDEVRERTVTADSVAESVIRSLLRRKSREQLDEPPSEAQIRAEYARLPSDFLSEEDD